MTSNEPSKILLGDKLKQLRINAGIEIDVLSREQRIPKQYLESIENNQWDKLPGLAYTRSYLVSLSQRFALSKDDTIAQFELEIGKPTENQGNAPELLNFNTNGQSLRTSKKVRWSWIVLNASLFIIIFIALKIFLPHNNAPIPVNKIQSQSDSMTQSPDKAVDSLVIAAQNPSSTKDTLKITAKPESRLTVNALSDESAVLHLHTKDSTVNIEIRKGLKNYQATFSDTIELKISYPMRAELYLNDSLISNVPRGKFFKIYNGSILP